LNRIIKQIKFTADDIEHVYEELVMAYSSDDIMKLLTLSGFQVMATWGDYHGSAMHPNSPRCIFIAQKIH
jgi:hypothetical protein